MAKKKWHISPTHPIEFEAELKDANISDNVQNEIAKAVQQTVVSKLQEHGVLERGASVAFTPRDKNIIIKPPKR